MSSSIGARLAAAVALQKEPQFAHPYFWAPFTVVGDGARPLPQGSFGAVASR